MIAPAEWIVSDRDPTPGKRQLRYSTVSPRERRKHSNQASDIGAAGVR
jgi:hypothetical protein